MRINAILLILGICAFAFIAFVFSALSAEKKCLVAGYPETQVDYTLEFYCVKRINQTDVVVPLRKAAP